MPIKFQRGYILTVEPPFDILGGGDLASTGRAGVAVSNPITVEFSIRRDTFSSANTATFRIFNLSEKTRNQLYKDKNTDWVYMPIRFQAGYGTPLPFIFKGNVMEAKSYRAEGSHEFITEITAYDMAFAMAKATSSMPFPGGTNQSQVIEYLIGDLKKYFVERGVISDYSTASYDRGLRVFGSTWEALQSVKGDKGLCFIDLGKVNVLKDGEAIEGAIQVISSDTGLLGSPSKSENWVIADMLFTPEIVVGQLVDLESRSNTNFNGQRQVIGIQHTGIISDAVNGKCKTKVTMYYNIKGYKTLQEAAKG